MMDEKNTDDLNNELMSQPNLDAYIHENVPHFIDHSFAILLNALYERKALSKAAIARKGYMSEVYLHQVFSGRRKPSRDRLICICIGLEATLDETQQLLKRAGFAQLYPKRKRDAIICHGLVHQTDLGIINDKLFEENEPTLF